MKLKKYIPKDNKKAFMGFLYLVGAVLVIVFAKNILGMFKSIGNMFTDEQGEKEKKKQEEVNKEILDEVKKTIIKTNLKHSDAYYKQIAKSQYLNMQGIGTTDTKEMVDQLKLMNKDELLTIYDNFAFSVNSWFNPFGWFDNRPTSIIEWYKEEVDNGDPEYYELKAIWSRSGLAW